MATAIRIMTADEFSLLPNDGLLHDLIDGEVRTVSRPGGLHGEVAGETFLLLAIHVKTHGLGRIYAAETGFLIKRGPDTVRGADVAFVRRERFEEIVDRPKYVPFGPDLAAEVKSPNDRRGEIAKKTRDWLDTGTRLVWNIDPEARTATVHRPGAQPIALAEDDFLDGEDVVPGFRCRVADLFT